MAVDRHAAIRAAGRDRRRNRDALRRWTAYVEYEYGVRVSFARVHAKARLNTLRRTIAAWTYYHDVIRDLEHTCDLHITRKNTERLLKFFTAWDVEHCAERHENRRVDTCERHLAELFLRRVMKSWAEVTRRLYIERRVTRTYHARRRRVMLTRFIVAWRYWRRDEIRSVNRDAKASAHLQRRVKKVAWRGWYEKAAASKRYDVAVSRARSRARRRVARDRFGRWLTATTNARRAGDALCDLYVRRRQRRLRHASLFAWWHAARERGSGSVALARADKHFNSRTARTRVLRPWLARCRVIRRGTATADVLLARRRRSTAARAFSSIRQYAMTRRVAAAACEAMRSRREATSRWRAWATWRRTAEDTALAVERHVAMRRRRVLVRATHAWVIAATTTARGVECARRVARVARRELQALTFGAWRRHAADEGTIRRRVARAAERFTSGRAFERSTCGDATDLAIGDDTLTRRVR